MGVSVFARGWKIARGATVGVGVAVGTRVGSGRVWASGHFGTRGGRRRAPASTPSHSALTRARSAAANSPRVWNPAAATGAGGGGRAEPSVGGSVSNHAETASSDTDASCGEGSTNARGWGQRRAGGSGDGSENTGGGDEYLEERVHRADAGVRAEAEGRGPSLTPRGSGCPSWFERRTRVETIDKELTATCPERWFADNRAWKSFDNRP